MWIVREFSVVQSRHRNAEGEGRETVLWRRLRKPSSPMRGSDAEAGRIRIGDGSASRECRLLCGQIKEAGVTD